MATPNTRVSDLAKQVGMEPGDLIPILQKDFGHRVRTASSSIPTEEARKVVNRLRLQKRRASRVGRDRKTEARENIRRSEEQRRLREEAQERERAAAEEREKEQAAVRAQQEAERAAREEEERKQREEAEREAARLAAERAAAAAERAAAAAAEREAREREEAAAAARAAAEAAAAAEQRKAETPPPAPPAAAERPAVAPGPEPVAPAAIARPATSRPAAAPPAAPRPAAAPPAAAPRGAARPAAAPPAAARPAASHPAASHPAAARPAASHPAAPRSPAEPAPRPGPPGPRRIETGSIAARPGGIGFRPGATDRKIVPTLQRPVKRPTPPRLRPTPPPLRTDRQLVKPRRPGPGKKSRRARVIAAPETSAETGDGLDSLLPPGLRAANREYTTEARVALAETITVKDLGEAMSIPNSEVIKSLLLNHGVVVKINDSLDASTAAKVVTGFGGTVAATPATNGQEKPAAAAAAAEEPEAAPDPDLVERAPVVTVMGHVDHGKTSILDAIRESRVAAGEAGGITQHLSAYRVAAGGRHLVFLDTPGHEAFTRMRARGAGVTDVVILVVAADDGVKEQTVEALNHARAAAVPILVAVNKMDLPAANPDQVMRQLAERGITPEEWGGDTLFCRVSAKTHDGLPELLQSVLDVAELEEPMANPQGAAEGVVLEARKDRGRGPVAQMLVQGGTLAVGDTVSAGAAWGKVRALLGEGGRRLKTAPPSTPVEVLGLSEVPSVGDRFVAHAARADAKRLAEGRAEKERLEVIEGRRRLTLQNLHAQLSGGLKELPIVVKGDVGGSVEAVCDALSRLGGDEVKVRVVHSAAGGVTESDVDLAATTDAIVVAFGVRPEPSAERLAEREGVEIRPHTIIYHLTEEIEKALAGLLEPETEVVELGRIEVRKTFSVPKAGTIAGCYVLSGAVPRSARVRLVRDSRVVHEGRIGSLRRFKEDVAQVREGFECGVGIAGYNDVKIGDVIEAFQISPVKPAAA